MSPEEIVRAWKDEDYRDLLSPEQRAALPDHPAGPLLSTLWELPEDEEARSLLLWCAYEETLLGDPLAIAGDPNEDPEGTR
jgi:mersacidin/lichenicidin family type 2 lantibiotic